MLRVRVFPVAWGQRTAVVAGGFLALTWLVACAGRIPNQAPALAPIDDAVAVMGETLLLPFTVSDEDPDALTFEFTSDEPSLIDPAAIGVSGTGTSRSLRLTAGLAGDGTVGIGLTARDGQGATDTASFSVEIRRPYSAGRQRLDASEAEDLDFVGSRVALSGDLALVTAYGDDDGGDLAGAAYGFARVGGTWTEQQKLVASDAAAGAVFGASVAVAGTTAILGSQGHAHAGASAGAAYVFEYDGANWSETKTLTAADAAASDSFGVAVAVSGDLAVVGAPGHDGGGNGAGAAYVYARDDGAWTELTTLFASEPAAGDGFGWAVAVDGERIVVGAPGGLGATGAAYVFDRDGDSWGAGTRLSASDPAANDAFGNAVAVRGDHVAVGAYGKDDGAGAVYVFRPEGDDWVEAAKLTAPEPVEEHYFGQSVAMHGDRLVVGAPGDAEAGPGSGAAFVFGRDEAGWVQVHKLLPHEGTDGGYLGESVALDGDHLVAGAWADGAAGAFAGAAYVFAK
jgi:hypothetical protein